MEDRTSRTGLAGNPDLPVFRVAARTAWIDHNNHLAAPYYGVLFTQAVTQAMEDTGAGQAYTATGAGTFVAAESHLRFLREVGSGMMPVTVRLLQLDAKRLHWWAEMTDRENGPVCATFEMLSLHMRQATKSVMPMPDDMYERFDRMYRRTSRHAVPEGSGNVWRRRAASGNANPLLEPPLAQQ